MEEFSPEKILITGVSGSGGSYLAEYIHDNHPTSEIHGISRWHSTASNKNLERVLNHVTVHECDLTDYGSVIATLQNVKPDAVFHLASYANVRTSFDTPLTVLYNNIMGTANMLDALHRLNLNPRLQICSTPEVYGQPKAENLPITESCPIEPLSPYAVSKTTQDMLGKVYHESFGMHVVRTRMFTYINPKRRDLFATSFAYQVAEIEAGKREKLFHGNLDSTRTIIDVRDAMHAYWLALEKGKPGEVYNIAGEQTVTVGQFLETLKNLASCDIPSEVDPKLYRPIDVTLQIPDTTKFKEATGWKQRYSYEESITFLLNHCRAEVKNNKQ